MKKAIRKFLAPIFKKYEVLIERNKQETDALYKLLYDQVHDLDQALPLATSQTTKAFGFQWAKLQEGEAMLSDKWFKENVTKIIAEKELLIDEAWFKGKEVIDCGSGGGRWSYGMAKMGANITAVDINQSAIDATRDVLKGLPVNQEYYLTPLEELTKVLPAGKKYDLAWSFGVLQFCGSFNTAFKQVMDCVKDGGYIYFNVYGRESLSYEEDINLFKNRIQYNSLPTWKEKEQFLIDKAKGDKSKVHQMHDMYAPLLNRRLDFEYLKKMLEDNGFTDVTRTVKHTELSVRAVKKATKPEDKQYVHFSDNNLPWSAKYFEHQHGK